MEVKIGLQSAPRELVFDTDLTPDKLQSLLDEGRSSEGGLVAVTDSRGRPLLIAADKVAYVEFGTSTSGAVGFRS